VFTAPKGGVLRNTNSDRWIGDCDNGK